MNNVSLKIHVITEEFFQFSLVTYLLLLLAETMLEGSVTRYFNLNILLSIVLASGITMVLTKSNESKFVPTKRNIGADIQNSLLLALGAGLLVFYKTQSLGKISIVIAIISMGLTFLLSV